MRYMLFGSSGLRVSELCLGAMTFGDEWGWGATKDESRKVFDAFAEAGGNFIDTANRYTNGTSEKYLGEFLKGQRDRFVIATKYTLTPDPDDPNASGNHRKNMFTAVEASLKRLNTDYIDLYWLHAWDFVTPVEEVMRAFDDLVRSGKVHYIGISDTPAWIVSEANMMAELRGWTKFTGLQIQYSLVSRTAERDLLPMAKAHEITITPWGALGSGVLSGKYKGKSGQNVHSRGEWGDSTLNDKNMQIADVVEEVAKELGKSSAQVTLAWVRQQPFGNIIPIIGARNEKQLKDNLGCLDIEFSAAQLKKLNDVSQIELGFPHDFLKAPVAQDMVYGNAKDKLIRRG